MHFTRSLAVAAAFGAGCTMGRSIQHRHARIHEQEKRAVGDWVTATMPDGSIASWRNEYAGPGAPAAATPAASEAERSAAAGVYKSSPPTSLPGVVAQQVSSSTAAAAVASATPSATSAPSSGSGSGATVFTPFCGGKSKRASDYDIMYKGNTGCPGGAWGSNMMLIDASLASKYDYTIKVTGQHTEPWTFICWNKIGPTGAMDGWYGHKAISFNLAPNAAQYIAFDSNSQVSCSAAPASIPFPTDKNGGWGGTWYEADFANAKNNAWSGGDVSSIQAEAGGLPVYGMQAKWNGQTSSIGASLKSLFNAFNEAAKFADGYGFNIPAGKVAMEVVIDWQG